MGRFIFELIARGVGATSVFCALLGAGVLIDALVIKHRRPQVAIRPESHPLTKEAYFRGRRDMLNEIRRLCPECIPSDFLPGPPVERKK